MIKDMLVYLDGGAEDAPRLAYADSLGQAHGAFLTGLYCNIVPEMMLAGEPSMTAAQVVVDMQTAAIEAGHGVEQRLRGIVDKLESPAEFRRIDLFAGQAGHAIAAEARRADLFVATRPSGDGAEKSLIETVLFNSGRGVVLVPPGYKGAAQPETALIAWRNTREAARALAESLPILAKAKTAIVAVVREDGSGEPKKNLPGTNISRHLERHGVNVERREITGRSGTAQALLNAVEETGANMIVMGGYGHSRFREWVLGGVTRDILDSAPVPVMLAH